MKIVMLVGPPGAGKSTYVFNNRLPGDCQVDMDLIPKHLPQPQRREIRKHLLQRAAQSTSPHTAWFSTAAPTRAQRRYWREFVPIHSTIFFTPPLDVALQRQQQRDGPHHPLSRGVLRWYNHYEPPEEDEGPCLLYYPAMYTLQGNHRDDYP